MNGLEHGSHTDEPYFAVYFPVCVALWRVTECRAYIGKSGTTVRVIVKKNESYLALVALVGPSTRLSTTRRAVLTSRGTLCLLELADAALCTAQ